MCLMLLAVSTVGALWMPILPDCGLGNCAKGSGCQAAHLQDFVTTDCVAIIGYRREEVCSWSRSDRCSENFDHNQYERPVIAKNSGSYISHFATRCHLFDRLCIFSTFTCPGCNTGIRFILNL